MRIILLAVLLLAACNQRQADETASAPDNAAPLLPATDEQSQAALMMPLPSDKAQLERLVAMGYTAHDDHLHAPGVTACPKMGENPVM